MVSKWHDIMSPQPPCPLAPSPLPLHTVELPMWNTVGGVVSRGSGGAAPCAHSIVGTAANITQDARMDRLTTVPA